MDQLDQQIALQKDLNALIERYSQEFEMSYVSMVGVLELQKLELAHFLLSGGEDE